MATSARNIKPRYFNEAKKDLAAFGILPFSSNGSSGSMRHTVAEYHRVSIPATKDQSRGNPLPGQTHGTAPNPNNNTQYTFDSVTVLFAPFTSGIMGMPTFPYSPDR